MAQPENRTDGHTQGDRVMVLLHHDASPRFRELIESSRPDWVEVRIVAETAWEAFDGALPGIDVIWHVLEPLDGVVIERGRRLRLIQKLGVGVDTIDVATASSTGVRVANMPGTNTEAVAEMTVTLMLAAMRRIVDLDRQTRAGTGWQRGPADLDSVAELSGSRVGLVGMGRIARRVAEIVTAFGAEVAYTNRTRRDVPYERVQLDELAADCDVLSLHVPLTDDTHRVVDEELLGSMKPTAVIVNTARGALIDQTALIAALSTRTIAAAGLDVFAIEPTERDGLETLDNVVMTPHVAWLTPETLDRSLAVAYENCRRLRDGEELLHVVNEPEVLRTSVEMPR